MHFLFVLKLLLEKKGGEIFGDHNMPSGDQKFILDRQLAPILKSWFVQMKTSNRILEGGFFLHRIQMNIILLVMCNCTDFPTDKITVKSSIQFRL